MNAWPFFLLIIALLLYTAALLIARVIMSRARRIAEGSKALQPERVAMILSVCFLASAAALALVGDTSDASDYSSLGVVFLAGGVLGLWMRMLRASEGKLDPRSSEENDGAR